jgi:hypothetical protein
LARARESMMKTSTKFAVLVLAVPFALTLATCSGSSSNSIVASCTDDCDFEGQKRCMTATEYRECVRDPDGCLVWDCST